MRSELRIEPLPRSDWPELADALAGDGLPHNDIDAEDCLFFRIRDGDCTLGFVGLQGHGADRLLRSFWIAPALRRNGLGARVLDAIEQHARAVGIVHLHLLTTTASAFFSRHGFCAAERHSAPAGIAASHEFTVLCPASATYLVKTVASHA